MKSDDGRTDQLHHPSGPARDLWIEIDSGNYGSGMQRSGPARDLWIEIDQNPRFYPRNRVGSRKGPVD